MDVVTVNRASLPAPAIQRDVSVWSVLRQAVGQDLSKITVPVTYNEPLSFLQRLAEYMEYSNLLEYAAQQTDPLVRLQYVAAFAVSGLSSNWERLGKPFNPLLQETYQITRDNFRFVAEQVSHHPPVSAFHASSLKGHYVFHGAIQPKIRFWAKSLEVQPKGTLTLELPQWGEAYTWGGIHCCIHNLLAGQPWMEQCGTLEVVCHKSGSTACRATLTFKNEGTGNGRDLHRVEGFLYDEAQHCQGYLYGSWKEALYVTDMASYEERLHSKKREQELKRTTSNVTGSPARASKALFAKFHSLSLRHSSSDNEPSDESPSEGDGSVIPVGRPPSPLLPNSRTLWSAQPRPPDSSKYYHFTQFTMNLNSLPADTSKLCPTDSRLRPDIRCLENGQLEEAGSQKTRLEEKQRQSKKARKLKKEKEMPRWFQLGTNPYTHQEDWLYSGGFWDGNYVEVDIF